MSIPKTIIDGKPFTCNELKIMKLIMQGLIRKEVAQKLNKSESTIDSQMRIIYMKVGVKRLTPFVNWGHSCGFDSQGNFISKEEAPLIPQKKVYKKPARKKPKTKKRK